MKLAIRHAPLLLVLLPSVATSIAAQAVAVDTRSTQAVGSLDSRVEAQDDAPAVKPRYELGSKVAPVDGKDGKPHNGPWVETDGKTDSGLPPLKGRPEDPTMIDGKKIPETNDGVMDDRNRQPPKQGTTGTEGGVSEKEKARKAKEGETGAKVENRPETPKEAPPLPHSEEEKMMGEKGTKPEMTKEKSDASSPEKPGDLPGKTHDSSHPVPDAANKDHPDASSHHTKGPSTAAEDADGLIQPLHSFLLSLTMILFSEVGDKTFLVAALMAMKHDRMVVFSAAFSALLVMTVLSAVLGHAVPTLIPKRVTSFLASALFFVFGAKLLREGLAMDPDEGVAAEMHEVELELAEKEKEGRRGSAASPYALEMGINGRTPRSKGRFPTPPRSPSTSPSPARSPSPRGGSITGFTQGLYNLLSLLLSPAWVQTFIMTFLGEWGDRSQIATIAMAAGQDYWWVTFGALLGHWICTAVAVIGGRAIAGRVSMKVVTVGGSLAFLLFGFIYFFEALYA